MVAVERRIVTIRNDCIYVDQKALIELRLELHIALHVFRNDMKALFELPGETIVVEPLSPPAGAPPAGAGEDGAWADLFAEEEEDVT